MKSKPYILLTFILCLLLQTQQQLYSQLYPVQAVPTVLSPYSSKLSDYSNALANRINLQLITTDLLVQNRPAQLHLKIQGNGITAQSAGVLSGIHPVYLSGGEILSLTSAELAGYFRYQNLQGLTTTRYSEPLPDGVYTICFQVYDLMTRKWLSQNSCATIYLMLNDPPQLNLPSNLEQIPSSDFPNIVFSWTPRHINAVNVSYDFELKEILNNGLEPAFAFEVSPLLYKEEGLRTSTLLYDISKPVLIPGKTYAWRVKAISTSGIAENSVFKNNGYSQIYSFKYTTNCTPPRYLLSEQQSSSIVKLMWQGETSHRKYHIQYRKANVEKAEWFEVFTINTQTILQDLEAGFTYEFRVGASCESEQYGIPQSYVYSGIQTFTLEKDEKGTTSYNCGIVPNIKLTNRQPLGAMVENETFMAGDFPVKVLEVSGGNGTFSGKGYIQVPYLFDTRIDVVFDNVHINKDYQLIDGVVETTYDPNWGNVEDADDFIKDLLNEIRDFYDDLVNGNYDNKTDEEKVEIIDNHEDKIDKIKNQVDDWVNEGIITDEKAKDLKDQLENAQQCSESGIYCKVANNPETPSNRGPSSYYKFYTDCEDQRKSCRQDAENILDEIKTYDNQLTSKKELIDYLKDEGITEFVYSTLCKNLEFYQLDYHIRFHGKLKGNELIVKTKAFGLANDLDISEDKLSDLTGINDLDNQSNFLAYKTAKGWKLLETKILRLRSSVDCPSIGKDATAEDISQIYDEFKNVEAHELGLSVEDHGLLSNNLNELNKNKRDDQDIELEHWDKSKNKLRYFTLVNGKLTEVKKPLTDEQINEGNWQGGKETRIRYTVNNGGIVQIRAFGFRKDLKIYKNKATHKQLKDLAKHIKDQSNSFLSDNKVTNFSKSGSFTSDEAFADGKKIEIKGKYIKIISEGIGLTSSLLKTGEIEAPTYLDQSNATIKAPGLVTGSVEVVAQKVTDITSLATGVYDLVVDKQVRTEAYNGLVQVKEAIGNDTGAFLPIMVEVFTTVATGNTTADWKVLSDKEGDKGRKSHIGTRGIENAIVTTLSGIGFVKQLPEIADKLGEAVRKVKKAVNNAKELVEDIVKNRNKIRKVLEVDIGKDYAKKYFDKFETGNFEDWYTNTFKKYDLGEPLNFEVHHVIPVKVLEGNKELQELLFWAKKEGKHFDFNSIDNGIPLQKKSVKYDVSGHANHPNYDREIGLKIRTITNSSLSDEKKFEAIKNLIDKTKNTLEGSVLLGIKDVNDIINF